MPRRCITGRGPRPNPNRIRPTADEIAARAFELYERRCSIDGWDLDDPYDAEPGPVEERLGHRGRNPD